MGRRSPSEGEPLFEPLRHFLRVVQGIEPLAVAVLAGEILPLGEVQLRGAVVAVGENLGAELFQ